LLDKGYAQPPVGAGVSLRERQRRAEQPKQ
jgi:hypothetical protein